MKKALAILAALLLNSICMADPYLSDGENYKRGAELYRQGHYQEAYDLYFIDMSSTPKNKRWLANYRDQLAAGETPELSQAGFSAPDKSAIVRLAPGRLPFKPKMSVFFSLGAAAPTAPREFEEYWKIGGNAGAGLGIVVSRITTIQAEIQCSSFSIDKGEFDRDLRLDGGTTHTTSFLLNGKFNFMGSEGKVNPYIIAGAGVGECKIDDTTIVYPDDSVETVRGSSESQFEMRIGFGLDVPLSDLAIVYFESNGFGLATDYESTSWGTLNLGMRFEI